MNIEEEKIIKPSIFPNSPLQILESVVTVNNALEEREIQTVGLLQKVGAGFKLHTAHCILDIAHCTLNTARCTLCTTHCVLHTAQCALHIVHFTLHTAHSGD